MSTTKKLSNFEESVILEPSYRLPLIITFSSLIFLLTPFKPWPSILIGIFGLFLLLQSFTLRLKFTEKDLIVMQLGKELRRFPFQNWIAWRILTPQLPILLYFREEASPHLLPILFKSKELEKQLKMKVDSLEIKSNNTHQ